MLITTKLRHPSASALPLHACRTYTRIDVFALCYSFLLNCLALRMAVMATISLSSNSSGSGTATAVVNLFLNIPFLLFYIISAAVQLRLLHKQPETYKRYRLVVHLVNRLVRLGMMFVVAR
jgi:hypothetical protein